MPKQATKESIVYISFQLRGDQAQAFQEWKAAQFLHNNAEAARKLCLERLCEVTANTKGTRQKPEKQQADIAA